MARHGHLNWNLSEITSLDIAKGALLMDLRDELKQINRELASLNRLMNCSNTLAIPRILRRISANTAKPRKKGKSGKNKSA